MNSFLHQNALFFILMNSGNLLNYLFQLVMARNLTPEDYGAFNSINSLAVLTTIFLMVIPIVLAKFTVKLKTDGNEKISGLLYFCLKWLTLMAGGAIVIGLFLLPLLKNYLSIEASLPILIMLLQVALTFLLPVPMGILQGLQRFLGMGLTGFVGTFFRFFCGVFCVLFLGWGMNGALFAGLVGVAVSIFVGLFFLKDLFLINKKHIQANLLPDMAKFCIPVLFTSFGIGALGNIDLVFARHYCLPIDAGFYATGAILGRIAFYLPGILILVLFPSAAKAHNKGEMDFKTLWWSLGLTAVLAGSFILMAGIWPEKVILMLYGEKYIPAAELFRLISIAMAMLAVCNVFFTFSLAHSNYRFIGILYFGLSFMVGSVYIFHDTPQQIAWALFGAAAFILIGTLIWFLSTFKKQVKKKSFFSNHLKDIENTA